MKWFVQQFLPNIFEWPLTDTLIESISKQVKYKVRNPFTKKKIWEFVRWDELNQVEEVGEKRRMKTIDEIKEIIKNKWKVWSPSYAGENGIAGSGEDINKKPPVIY